MTQISQSAYWLTLTYASGLRLARVKAIVADWCLRGGHPLSDLSELSPADLAARPGLTGEECEVIQTPRGHVSRQAVWASDLASKGVHIVHPHCPVLPRGSHLLFTPPTTTPFALLSGRPRRGVPAAGSPCRNARRQSGCDRINRGAGSSPGERGDGCGQHPDQGRGTG